MSELFEEQSEEGVEGLRRQLLAALAAAGLTDEEVDVFLDAQEVADLAELASLVERPPREVRELLRSAYRKIRDTGLLPEEYLPEVPGL